MPLMSNDFWTSYKNQGGKEQGGCNTGGGGLLALAGAALALLRRRS
jgi:Synergist-CTERM protein sorting domain-containing protein